MPDGAAVLGPALIVGRRPAASGRETSGSDEDKANAEVKDNAAVKPNNKDMKQPDVGSAGVAARCALAVKDDTASPTKSPTKFPTKSPTKTMLQNGILQRLFSPFAIRRTFDFWKTLVETSAIMFRHIGIPISGPSTVPELFRMISADGGFDNHQWHTDDHSNEHLTPLYAWVHLCASFIDCRSDIGHAEEIEAMQALFAFLCQTNGVTVVILNRVNPQSKEPFIHYVARTSLWAFRHITKLQGHRILSRTDLFRAQVISMLSPYSDRPAIACADQEHPNDVKAAELISAHWQDAHVLNLRLPISGFAGAEVYQSVLEFAIRCGKPITVLALLRLCPAIELDASNESQANYQYALERSNAQPYDPVRSMIAGAVAAAERLMLGHRNLENCTKETLVAFANTHPLLSNSHLFAVVFAFLFDMF